MKSVVASLRLAGAIAFLVFGQSAAASQGRDLWIDPNSLNTFIEDKTFSPSDCAIDHGCASAGTRRLLKFSTVTRNIGDTAVDLGNVFDPNGPFTLDPCHTHSHYGKSTRAELLDGAVPVAVSEKLGFCLVDSIQWDPNANPFPIYDCFDQGIQPGWADEYSSSLDCQWIDITDVAGGTYTFRITANPDNSTVLEDPNNFGNNAVEVEVVIPPLAGEGIPTLPHWALILFAALMLLGAATVTRRAGLRPDAVRPRAAPEPRPKANR